MRVRKVSDQRFMVETTSPSGYSWSGELRGTGTTWELIVGSWTQGAVLPKGSPISRQGVVLRIGTFEWLEKEQGSNP